MTRIARLLIAPFTPAVIAAWLSILFGVALLSLVGLALAFFLAPWIKTKFRPFDLPILGLPMAIWYAEIWSLFGAIDSKCIITLIALSAGGILLARRRCKACLEQSPTANWRQLSALLVFSILVALNSATYMKHGDSGLYHLNGIRWLEEWGTVPGLANLHARLGFNCSLFVAVALFDGFFPAAQVTNGIVILICGIYVFGCLTLSRDDPRRPGFLFLASAFGGLICAALAKFGSSPSPDVSESALAICTLVVGSEVFLLAKPIGSDSLWRSILLLSGIASVQARFKASGIIMATAMVVCVGLALSLRFESRRSRIQGLILILSTFSILLLPWLIRGYITSGYPFFPSTLLGAPVDWKVPPTLANDEANWIYSWARDPNLPWQQVLSNNHWMGPWLRRNSMELIARGILPFWLICLVILIITWSRSTGLTFPLWKLLCSLPIILGVAFWFCTAPDPRFSEGLLWTVGLVLLLYAFQKDQDQPSVRRRLIYLIFLATPILFVVLSELGRLSHEKRIFPARYRIIPLTQKWTRNGVPLWVPQTGGQVGDSPLPATVNNRFQPDLEYRGKTLRDGFRIKGGIPLISD